MFIPTSHIYCEVYYECERKEASFLHALEERKKASFLHAPGVPKNSSLPHSPLTHTHTYIPENLSYLLNFQYSHKVYLVSLTP